MTAKPGNFPRFFPGRSDGENREFCLTEHNFAEMLKTRYPADGATRFLFVSSDAEATDTLRDAAAMGKPASQDKD